MNIVTTRRDLLRGIGGAAAIGASGGCCSWWKRSGRIRLAAVGIMGKGFSDWMTMLRSGMVEMAAFCDADAAQRSRVLKSKAVKDMGLCDLLANVPFYTDYRKMLDDQSRLRIDAMTVSTPDHMHAAQAVRAMKMGIHCYVQKPLVRTFWELRRFQEAAMENGVVTQMGNQGSSFSGFRRGVEIIRSGVLGDVREVHVWTNRPLWPQGVWAKRVASGAADPIPEGLDWDSWIGTAEMRNYKGRLPDECPTFNPSNPKVRYGNNVYHTFNWRGFLDFGAGAFGDMACHTMNLPFRGLELGEVLDVECVMAEERNDVSFPTKSTVKITFAERDSKFRRARLPAVTLFWYDGSNRPAADIMPDGKLPNTGCVLVGTKGTLCSTDSYGKTSNIAMRGETAMQSIFSHPAVKDIGMEIPRCDETAVGVSEMGGAGVKAADNEGQYIEFLKAINGDGPVFAETGSRCFSDVDYSVPIMESILCGVVAQRVGGRLKWDSATQSFDNAQANALVKPYIRRGFEF